MDWFTGDFHLNHEGIMISNKRPFRNVEEMNFYLVDLIIKNVGHGDRLFLLGDMVWRGKQAVEFLLSQCPPETHIVLGNHDRRFLQFYIDCGARSVREIIDIKIEGQKVTLCHYAMRTWNCSHWGAWQLYAHSHGKLSPIGLQHDVGIDNNNYQLLNWENVKTIMGKKQHDLIPSKEE